MKKTNTKVTRYTQGIYIIDIIDDGSGTLEAWLSKKDYGQSMFMFGCKWDYDHFLELVSAHLVDQIEYFEEQNEICEKALEEACL